MHLHTYPHAKEGACTCVCSLSLSLERARNIDDNNKEKKKENYFSTPLELHYVYICCCMESAIELYRFVEFIIVVITIIIGCVRKFSCKLTHEMRSMLINHLMNGLPPNESGAPFNRNSLNKHILYLVYHTL